MSNSRPVKTLIFGDEFTEEDAENNRIQLNGKEIRNYEFYDEKFLKDTFGFRLMKSLTKITEPNEPEKLAHCELIRVKNLKPKDFAYDNLVWNGKKNPAFEEIKTSINENGYELWHKPASLFRDENGLYYFIDGRTHCWILVNVWGFKNIIADIYEKHPNSKIEVMRARRLFARIANLVGQETRGKPKMHDLIEAVHEEIKNKTISINSKGEPDYDEVMEFLKYNYGGYVSYTKTKFSEIGIRAVNSYEKNKSGKKIFLAKSDATDWVTNIDEGRNYIDRDAVTEKDESGNEICKRKGIKYLIISTEQSLLAVRSAAAMSVNNSNCEIRVIVYKKICEVINPLTTYDKGIKDFREEFNRILDSISSTFFNGIGRKTNKVKLYGAIPSLGEWHNLDELILFDDKVKNQDDWYQKNPVCDNYDKDKNQENNSNGDK